MFWDIIGGGILVLLGLQILLNKVFQVKVPLLQIGLAILLIIGGISMLMDQKPLKHFMSKFDTRK